MSFDTLDLPSWPSVCRLTIPGDPQSKGRPRVYNGHGITPEATRKAENRVYSEWRRQYPDLLPYKGPVAITLIFWTMTRRGRDWDNLAKLFTDALNGVAYEDDRPAHMARQPLPAVHAGNHQLPTGIRSKIRRNQ